MPAACVFCEIAAERKPASLVHQDGRLLAFMSNAPVNAGHLLVIPRLHATSLADLEPDVGADLFRVAQRLGAALRRSTLRCEGSISFWPTARPRRSSFRMFIFTSFLGSQVTASS